MRPVPTSADETPPPARALAWLHRVEDGVLAGLLGTLVLLAPLQILLRNAFDAGVPWIDPLLRTGVLWLGLLGALAASRGDRHIRVDVAARALPPRAGLAARILTSLATAAICGVVAYHAGRFVGSEWEAGAAAWAGVPAWLLAAVIPFAFGAMALRHALHAWLAAVRLARSNEGAR